jgi:adenylate cyclase
MGRVVLRGRARPVDLFEPAPDFAHSDRVKLAKAIELVDSNRSAAIVAIEAIVASNPADKALQNLLMRCQHLNEDGSYVLD